MLCLGWPPATASDLCLFRDRKGVIDLDAERGRLKRDIAKEQSEIDKIDKKLGNEQFLAKAAEEVIEEQRTRREESLERLKRLQEALSRLS